MEQSLVHWEMMELLPMETLVVLHVTLVMSYLEVTLVLVKVMEDGVVVKPCVLVIYKSVVHALVF